MARKYYKAPPSSVSSRGGVSQVPVEYRSLGKTVRDRNGDSLEVYFPFPKIEPSLVEHPTIYQNMYLRSERGYTKLSPEEANYFNLTLSDVSAQTNKHILSDALKRNGLEVKDTKLEAAARDVGQRFWALRDTLNDLAQEASEIAPPGEQLEEIEDEEPTEAPPVAEADKPLTKRNLQDILVEQERIKAYPWLARPISELSDEDLVKLEKSLKLSYSTGAEVPGFPSSRTTSKPTPIPEIPTSEPEEAPDDSDLLNVPKDAHRDVMSMNNKELALYEKSLKGVTK